MAVYKRDGAPTRDEAHGWPTERDEGGDVAAFLREMLTDVSVELPRAVVIDVGHIRDRGVAVVEANEAWASGVYGCDPQQVLEVVRHATVAKAAIDPVDAPWVINTRTVE